MDVKVFDKITDKLVESKTISTEDRELYKYGLKQAVNTFATVATTLVIGFVFGMIWQSILFTGAYIPLRSYAGGYHARTPLRCYIFSVILTVCVLFTIKYIPYDKLLILGLILISGTVISIFVPVEDENKPLDEIETKVFRKRARIILFAEVALAVLFLILGWTLMAVCVTVSAATASFMVVAGILRKLILEIRK